MDKLNSVFFRCSDAACVCHTTVQTPRQQLRHPTSQHLSEETNSIWLTTLEKGVFPCVIPSMHHDDCILYRVFAASFSMTGHNASHMQTGQCFVYASWRLIICTKSFDSAAIYVSLTRIFADPFHFVQARCRYVRSASICLPCPRALRVASLSPLPAPWRNSRSTCAPWFRKTTTRSSSRRCRTSLATSPMPRTPWQSSGTA